MVFILCVPGIVPVAIGYVGIMALARCREREKYLPHKVTAPLLYHNDHKRRLRK